LIALIPAAVILYFVFRPVDRLVDYFFGRHYDRFLVQASGPAARPRVLLTQPRGRVCQNGLKGLDGLDVSR
jgi:hypothetical protein